jgi:hypothetical protein
LHIPLKGREVYRVQLCKGLVCQVVLCTHKELSGAKLSRGMTAMRRPWLTVATHQAVGLNLLRSTKTNRAAGS